MYSAVKVQGVPLYKAARAGLTVSRSPREFTVHSLEILSISPTAGPPPATVGSGGASAGPPPAMIDVTFDVVCSKGTYVRTLCADIGEALGVGGHLASLERRRVGRFCIEQALSLDELAGLADRGAVETRLYTLAAALADLPALHGDRDAGEGPRPGVAVPVSRNGRAEGARGGGAFCPLQA